MQFPKLDMTSEKLKAILWDIYQPKVDFSIVLTDRKQASDICAWRMG